MRKEIVAPRLGTNDDTVTIGVWLIEQKSKVDARTPIVVLESSKQTIEILSDNEGYIFQLYEDGDFCEVGKVIAYIYDTLEELEEFLHEIQGYEKEQIVAHHPKITQKALSLAKKHNIDYTKIEKDGIIKEKDIQEIINEAVTDESRDDFFKVTCNDIILMCGGGLCKMTIDAIRSRGGINIVGILDNQQEVGSKIMGISILGSNDMLEHYYSLGYRSMAIALGSITSDNTKTIFFRRKELFLEAKSKGYMFPNIIHAKAIVAPSARLGEGNLVFAGALIDSEALIGDNTIINTGSIISHDCVIGSHSRISPGATLAGNVYVGENSIIGMGVNIYIGVHIGKNVIIGNGKSIFIDVPDNSVIL